MSTKTVYMYSHLGTLIFFHFCFLFCDEWFGEKSVSVFQWEGSDSCQLSFLRFLCALHS